MAVIMTMIITMIMIPTTHYPTSNIFHPIQHPHPIHQPCTPPPNKKLIVHLQALVYSFYHNALPTLVFVSDKAKTEKLTQKAYN